MRRIKPADLKNVRAELAMSQSQFARAFGLPLRTYQKWESGEKSPSGAAAMFLRLIVKDPQGILKALSDET
jgi:putative transcriptional regulator